MWNDSLHQFRSFVVLFSISGLWIAITASVKKPLKEVTCWEIRVLIKQLARLIYTVKGEKRETNIAPRFEIIQS